MTLATERQKFEEWFKDSYHLAEEHLSLGEFGSDTTQTSWKAWQASRELLANREAQPVYQYRMRNPYNGQVTDWETTKPEQVDFILKETIAANVEFRIIAAPPAPAVPEELLEAMEEVIRISDRDHEAWNKAKAAITACCAAMLNGGKS